MRIANSILLKSKALSASVLGYTNTRFLQHTSIRHHFNTLPLLRTKPYTRVAYPAYSPVSQQGMELLQVAFGIAGALVCASVVTLGLNGVLNDSLLELSSNIPAYTERFTESHTIADSSSASILQNSNAAGWIHLSEGIYTFSLAFHADGAQDVPASITLTTNAAQAKFTIPAQTPTLSGKKFLGWTNEEALLTSSQTKQALLLPGDIMQTSMLHTHLFAQWE